MTEISPTDVPTPVHRPTAPTKEVFRSGDIPLEVYGLADAVRVGDAIYLSGQTAHGPDGSAGGRGDVGTQMRLAYQKVVRALEALGASMRDVVDETLLVTDLVAAFAVVQEVRHDVYEGRFDLASTIYEVSALATPDTLVEIKCIAHLGRANQ